MTQPAGTPSSIVRLIARRTHGPLPISPAALELEAGATSDLVRGIIGSRPLGGGW